MNNELRFFGTDSDKDNFVIFELVRESAPNIYYWVVLPGDESGVEVKLNPVTKLFSYSEHFCVAYWVKEDGVEEMIEEALNGLDEMPGDEMADRIKKFDEKYNPDGKPDSYYERIDKLETDVWGEIEKARDSSGYWPFNP